MISSINFRKHIRNFINLIRTFIKNRELLWQMTIRDIYDRYTGQVFGVLWSVGHPLFLMGIYVFVFVFVFKLRTGGTRELPLDYTTYLLSGLIPWMTCQEAMMKSCGAIINQSNLVKQVVFPIEILPVKGVLASFFAQIVSTVILIIYILVTHGSLPWTYILLPFLFLIEIIWLVGLSFLFSAVSVYFRDLKDFVQVYVIASLYALPLFYTPAMLGTKAKIILSINPFSFIIWCYRDVCFYGRFEHPWAWAVCIILSLLILFSGYTLFEKLKTMFGNYL